MGVEDERKPTFLTPSPSGYVIGLRRGMYALAEMTSAAAFEVSAGVCW
jgi:hypothetical protein